MHSACRDRMDGRLSQRVENLSSTKKTPVFFHGVLSRGLMSERYSSTATKTSVINIHFFQIEAKGLHQPVIHVNGGLLNRVHVTLVKQLIFEVNLVFSPRTHKCRVGAEVGSG
eukprot:scaffold976_cov102-Skeletonema_dohrnii-CCMP3373.AAC.1